MGKLFVPAGLLFLVLVTLSFFSPAVEFVQSRSALVTAEEQLHDAERLADQATRENAMVQSSEHKITCDQATLLVRTRLDAYHKVKERQVAAWERLNRRYGRWAKVFAE